MEQVTVTLRTLSHHRSKHPCTVFNLFWPCLFESSLIQFSQHCAQSFKFLLFWKFLEVRKTSAGIKIDIVWLWCNPVAVFKSFRSSVCAGSTYHGKGKLIYFGLISNPGLMREGLHRVNQVENKQGWIIFKSQQAIKPEQACGSSSWKENISGFSIREFLVLNISTS